MANRSGTVRITGDPDADDLVNTNPMALLIAMLLDQQIPLEWAFASPLRLQQRLGGDLDVEVIASMDPDQLAKIFGEKPALHRYPAAMAKRTQALCQHIVDHYDGDARAVWHRSRSADRLFDRILALPGFGDEKSRIFLALLAKRFRVQPAGWETHAGPFADDLPRTAADIDGPEALARVRAWKREQKTKGLEKGD